jgi:copper ion binding protein
MLKKKKLKIEGMSCQMCVKHVTEALEGIAGVENVQVQLKKGQAKLRYDPDKADMSEFKSAVAEAGYEVVS